jgi:ubiquinone/menaquinone biosynthesis C-methylase UbiE
MSTGAREAYDSWHAAQQPDYASDAPWHEMLKPLLTGLGGRRVLEIGCGQGGFSVWLAELPPERRPAELIASDFSPVAVRKAEEMGRARGVTNVTYRIGDLMSLDWRDASFDVAISCETIEHVPRSEVALRELARVLRPGGRLYLTCPNYLNLMGLYRAYLRLTGRRFSEGGQPICHFLLWPRVRHWVKQAGLLIERTAGTGHYVPFPRRSPIRLRWADRLGLVGRLFVLHTLIVARKP